MTQHILTAEARTITGRKVKQLRAKGIVPANIFGKKIKSAAFQLDGTLFEKLYKEAGETGVIYLTVSGTKHPVLISAVQRHPVSGASLHVEFHEVDLKEKIKAMIPLSFEGESSAVAENRGSLLSVLREIEVEALPTELPEHIVVDISSLTDIDQEITVENLKTPSTVVILTDATLTVAKIAPISVEETPAATEETPAEGDATASKAPEGEGEPSKEGASEEKAAE